MTQPSPDLQSRVEGCLLGCAVGDALGAPFEGYWEHQLPSRAALLSGFREVEGYPLGQYTDDTQLSLATVESIVAEREIIPAEIAHAIASLWKHRSVVGPGGSCTFAANAFLKSRDWKTCGAPSGQAGNGTAMRTAMLGLFFLRDPERLPETVADISRITHQDSRSVAGGVAIAKAAQLLVRSDDLDATAFSSSIADAIRPFDAGFANLIEVLPSRLKEDRDTAFHSIAWAGQAKPEFSRPVITPFVIPTVLASLWALLRNRVSWPNAVCDAIQLGGDVDSLGAIVGALAGVRLGAPAIPAHLASSVLDSERIRILAAQYHQVLHSRLAAAH